MHESQIREHIELENCLMTFLDSLSIQNDFIFHVSESHKERIFQRHSCFVALHLMKDNLILMDYATKEHSIMISLIAERKICLGIYNTARHP